MNRRGPTLPAVRARWRKYQGLIEAARLVFIDETWVKTNMGPLRGWGPRGKRLVARVPHGHWRTLTFLAALRANCHYRTCLFDGPINGESFLRYVEQFLVPTLKPGDIVVMDNLGSHRPARSVRLSGLPVQGSSTFRPTVPISTPSSRPSQS